jgi:hypothetical protein
MFSVHAAGATACCVAGLPGETVAAVVSMFVGAAIGFATDEVSSRIGDR